MTPFHQVLANNAVANITNFTVWFALTFYVYIETQSVFATGMIAGVYLVLTAAFAIWFGSLVDAIGDWFGRGPDRGIALVFTIAGVIGLLITILAFNSRYYRQLSQAYARPGADVARA